LRVRARIASAKNAPTIGSCPWLHHVTTSLSKLVPQGRHDVGTGANPWLAILVYVRPMTFPTKKAQVG